MCASRAGNAATATATGVTTTQFPFGIANASESGTMSGPLRGDSGLASGGVAASDELIAISHQAATNSCVPLSPAFSSGMCWAHVTRFPCQVQRQLGPA